MGLIQIILQVFTFGLSALIFAFVYNKMYVNYRLEDGYKFSSVSGKKGKEEIEAELGIKLLEAWLVGLLKPAKRLTVIFET